MKNSTRLIAAIVMLLSFAGFNANAQQSTLMTDVYASYFDVKDAMVKSDGKTTSAKAAALHKAIIAVPMDKMTSEEHTVWMKVLTALKEDAGHISGTTDAKRQREHFVNLSKNMHAVIKVLPAGEPVYYQKCPMANGGKGANWLSKDKSIKNPYYGSAMLTCGSTVETLK